jgi:hypothetical protein
MSEVQPEEETPHEGLGARFRAWIKTPDFWVLLLPFLYYVALIRTEITFGDGPELLVAMHNLGGPHPSGYPLFTLLGFIPSHLPWVSPFWNVSVFLGALPAAVCVWALYRLLRVFDVSKLVSAISALAYATNYHVVYQSTRIEVYALHCMLIALSLWCLARFMESGASTDDEEQPGPADLRWAYGTVLFACLALTNHLTSAFLVLPVIIGLLVSHPRTVLRPKPIAIMFGIAAACALIYVYLPIQAMLNEGDRISWNDPQTWDRFWFHVTGQEYAIFRSTDKVLPTLRQFWSAMNASFFPGIIVVVAIGAYDWLVRHWKTFVPVVVFEASYLAYVATYPISDLSTYFTALFIPIIIGFAFGLDWLFRMRFEMDSDESLVHRGLEFVVMAVLFGWVIGLGWNSRANRWSEALAADMSRETYADMEGPAVIFTSVDGHTFPMWYQTMVEHPGEKEAVVVDTVMFHLKNKQWYRDWLRKWHPWVEWPDDETALGSRWRQWLIDNNPDINFYALLNRRWPHSTSYPVLRGWHHEIVDGREGKATMGSTKTRHIYIARQAPVSGNRFHTSRATYEGGVDRLACVVEWWKHDDFVAKWRFLGPNGEKYEFNNHKIPKGSNMSWEYLQPDQQTPGTWRCEVEAPGEPLMVREFTITE